MMRMTVDEFIKSGMWPSVRSRRDVFLLMRIGALRSEKIGRKRFVIIDYPAGNAESETRPLPEAEKRRSSIGLRLSPVLSYLLGHCVQKGFPHIPVASVDDYMNRFAKVIAYFAKFVQDSRITELSREQTVRLKLDDKLISNLEAIGDHLETLFRMNGRKRVYVNGKRTPIPVPELLLLMAMLIVSDSYRIVDEIPWMQITQEKKTGGES